MPSLRQPEQNPFRAMAGERAPEVPIAERVGKIIDGIEEAAKTVPRSDALALTSRMFEHSPEDGLKLAERLHLTPDELIDVCATPGFVMKHENVSREIELFAENHVHDIGADPFDRILSASDESESPPIAESLKLRDAASRTLYKDMEDAYAELLRRREIGPKPLGPSTEPNGIRMADHVLAEAEMAFQDSYYAGPVKDALDKLPPQKGVNASILSEWKVRLQTQDVVPTEELEILCREIQIDADKLKHDLRGQKYVLYKSLYGIQKGAAEKELKGEIRTMIRDDQDVVLNGKTGKYEIHIRKDIPTSEQKPTLPEVILLGFTDVDSQTLCKGTLYYRAKKDGKWCIVDSDGNILKKFRGSFSNLKNLNDRLYFIETFDGYAAVNDLNGRPYSQVMNDLYDFTSIDGKIIVLGTPLGQSTPGYRLIQESGMEIGRQHESISGLPEKIGKNIYFQAENIYSKTRRAYSDSDYLADGKGGRYGESDGLRSHSPIGIIDGKLYYYATNRNNENFLGCQDGKIYAIFGHSYVLHEGKLIFATLEGDGWRIIDTSGETYATGHGRINSLTYVGNRLIYTEEKNRLRSVKDTEGRNYGTDFENYFHPYDIDGALFFVGNALGKYRVYKEGKPISTDFDYISHIIAFDGKVFFYGKQDGKWLIADTDGKKYTEGFQSIDEFKILLHHDHPRITFFGKKDEGDTSRLYKIELPNNTFSSQAQLRLDLLNLVHDPDAESIEKHFASKEEESKEGTKGIVERSAMVATMLNRAIKEIPESFLATMGARRDRAPAILADRLISKMFPEAYFRSRNLPKTRGGWFDFLGGEGGRPAEFSPEDFFTTRDSLELMGGGAEMMDDERVVMEFREPMRDLVVTGLYGSYDSASNRWSKTYVPLRPMPLDPVRETTVTIPKVTSGRDISLPKPLDASLVAERVRGLKRGGKEEVELKPETNSLGESLVRNLPKVDSVAYTLTVGVAAEPMAQIDAEDYRTFAAGIAKAHGTELTKKLANLPEEADAYLASPEFTRLSPKDKVMAIEKYVRSLGYYDVNNQEVSGLKKGKSLEDRMMIAEMRLEELRAKHPDMSADYAGRKFAGVCADFAEITCAILRRAGLMSGIVDGLLPEGKEARVKHAHATAFVLWPDAMGQSRAVIVDGTPGSNDPRLRGMSMPSLDEREEQAQEAAESIIEEAQEELDRILGVIDEGNADDIRGLENGKLERVLNVILAHKVKQSHLEMLTDTLNFYWYGGVSKMDNMVQDMELKKTIEDYLVRQRGLHAGKPERQTHAGTKLFALVEDFVRRFRQGGKKNTAAALERLDRVLSLSEDSLEPTEAKAFAAIITYLKAKNMAGK